MSVRLTQNGFSNFKDFLMQDKMKKWNENENETINLWKGAIIFFLSWLNLQSGCFVKALLQIPV